MGWSGVVWMILVVETLQQPDRWWMRHRKTKNKQKQIMGDGWLNVPVETSDLTAQNHLSISGKNNRSPQIMIQPKQNRKNYMHRQRASK